MKTFKQYSKESKEDKGYYIDDDGVAVFTDILGHGDKSRSSDKPKKVVKEDASDVEDMAKNTNWSKIGNGKHVEEKSHQLLQHHQKHQEENPLSNAQKKAIRSYSNNSKRFNKHLIEKHAGKRWRREESDNHWGVIGTYVPKGSKGRPDDKERAAHDEMHEHLSGAYHSFGVHHKLWAGVSSRVSKAVKKSKDGIIHPGGGHVSTSTDKKVAEGFAGTKTDWGNDVGQHHYMCIHVKPHDKGLSTEKHSTFTDEKEVLIRNKLKHIGTTTHYEKTDYSTGDIRHHVDHFEIHHDESKPKNKYLHLLKKNLMTVRNSLQRK